MRREFYFAVLMVVGFGLRSLGQGNPQQAATPVFRSESRQVLVDAVVTDNKGHFVSDLTAGDFGVREDGKEQTIQSASRVSLSAGQKHYVVFYFDRLAGSDNFPEYDGVLQYLSAAPAGDNVFAVFQQQETGQAKLLQDFTADFEKLKRVVAEAKIVAMRTKRSTGSLEAAIGSAEGKGPPTKNVANVSDEIGTGRYSPEKEAFWNETRNLIGNLSHLAGSLGAIQGRKSVLLATPGLEMPASDEWRITDLITACNRANVAIYGVSNSNTLERLTHDTGGFRTGNPKNTLDGLQKVVAEQSEYYLLGYVPAVSTENSCHELKVSLRRPNLHIRARKQYCNVRSADPLAGTDLDKAMMAAAANANSNAAKQPIQLSFVNRQPNAARALITAEVPSRALRFEKQGGRLAARAKVLGIAYRPDGTVGARFSDEVDYAIDEKRRKNIHEQPVRYENQLDLAPGEYLLKVVFGSDPETFTTLEAPLRVDASESGSISISGLELCKEFREAGAVDANSVLTATHVALVSKGIEYIPASSTRLRRGEPTAVFFEVYDPFLPQQKTPGAKIELRIVDAKTEGITVNSGAIDATSWIRQGSTTIPIAIRLNTDKLPPGSYRMEVRAADADGNGAAVRTKEFTLD